MFDQAKLRENKDRVFEMFMSAVGEIAQGREPEHFRDTTYSLEHALQYFPKAQQAEIQAMVVTASEQYLYVRALDQVRMTEPGHEQREKQISEFLAKYHA